MNRKRYLITRFIVVRLSNCSPPLTDLPLLPNVPGELPVNNLLSVSAEAEHPNFVNPPKGEFEARRGADPF